MLLVAVGAGGALGTVWVGAFLHVCMESGREKCGPGHVSFRGACVKCRQKCEGMGRCLLMETVAEGLGGLICARVKIQYHSIGGWVCSFNIPYKD